MTSPVAFDLLTADKRTQEQYCDVCIVGAGAVGIYLARRLAARGVDVIVIEAGGAVCSDTASFGFAPEFTGEMYAGATEGRAFGVGGSTSRWGGLLIPHSRHDVRGGSEADRSTWAHVVEVVAENAETVLRALGFTRSPEFLGYGRGQLLKTRALLDEMGWSLAASLFLPFRHKNLACLLARVGRGGRSPGLIVNAVAKSWEVGSEQCQGASIRKVLAVAENGNQVTVLARRFVIAAGAIESARILLEMTLRPGLVGSKRASAIGCFLGDHLSVPIADVAESSRARAIQLFAPRFSGGWMRSFRFVESNPPTSAPRGFAHFIFAHQDAGFLLAKKVLGGIQGKRWPQVTMKEVVGGLGGVVALGITRYLRLRLHVPANTDVCLQLDLEQVPRRENRISLTSRRDRFGRLVPQICWRISDADAENISLTAERLLRNWRSVGKALPELVPRERTCAVTKPYDAYHPVGCCRMGDDAGSVVDKSLGVYGITNLWLVSTGILPSAGTANPTFTVLCCAERLAKDLAASATRARAA